MALLVIRIPSSVDQSNSSPSTQAIPQLPDSRRMKMRIAHLERTYLPSLACRFLGPMHRYYSKKSKKVGPIESSGLSITVHYFPIRVSPIPECPAPTVDQKITPIWNTMAYIPGHIKDEVVVVGNHRDGMLINFSPVDGF